MGANITYLPTLLDIARRQDPDGGIASVAEIMQQYNDILDDIGWKEGNLETGEQVTVRTSKPTPSFRLLNRGVVPAKSTTGQVVESCAILEQRSHIDVDVAMINGNTAAYRLSEDVAIIQGMMDQLATSLIYGDTSVSPEQFNGLASRYYTLNTSVTTYRQIIDAGGTGSDNTSIWLVCWAGNTVYGIYPKGSKAGLQQKDLGEQSVLDPDQTNNPGAYLQMLVSWYQFKCGIAIKDYRAVVRICNIDVSNLLTAGDASDASANILKFMSMALDKLPPNMAGRKVFYMNETVRSMIRVKMQDKSNAHITLEQIQGLSIPRPDGVLKYMGVALRRIDAILSTEARITT